MESQASAYTILVLRISTFIALVACIVTLLLNKITVAGDLFKLTGGETKITFNDVTTFRYVFYVAIIGACYTLLQLPFALHHAVKGKGMIRDGCLPEFDFYGDKVITSLLGTATGAGLAYSREFKSFLNNLFSLVSGDEAIKEAKRSYDDFLNRCIIASTILCLGFVLMVIVSVLTSSSRAKTTSFSG